MNRAGTLATLAVLGLLWLLVRPDAPAPDLHDRIQQRLLEAECGSVRTFHFAASPGAPVGNGEALGEVLAGLRALGPLTRAATARHSRALLQRRLAAQSPLPGPHAEGRS